MNPEAVLYGLILFTALLVGLMVGCILGSDDHD